MRVWISIALLWCFSSNAATWWVRPGVHDTYNNPFPSHPIPRAGVYGTQNGTSYANAWNGLYSIQWGPGGVNTGDTLNVCGKHIFYTTTGNNVFFAALEPLTNCPGITMRMDYAADPGTVFGGMLDHFNTYNWTGPDGNGVYKSVVNWNGTPYPPTFEITNGNSIVRLDNKGATTWTTGPGMYSQVAGSWITNYIKTLEGTAPGTNLAVAVQGYAFDMNWQSNLVFISANFISESRWNYNSPTNFIGPNHISFTNGTFLEGTYFLLFPGNDFWTFSGCEVGRAPWCILTDLNSQTRGANNLTVTGCYLHDTDTSNYPDQDGHAIGIQGGGNHVLTLNRTERTGSAIELWTFNQKMTNIFISRNFIKDTHKASNTLGGGITISGDDTASVVGNRVGITIEGNVMVNTGIGGTLYYHGYGISSNNKDPMIVWNNTLYGCLHGIGLSLSGVGTALQGSWRNNIVANPGDPNNFGYMYFVGGSYGAFDIGNNLYYPIGNTNSIAFDIFPAHDWGSGNVFSNPLFSSSDTTAWGAFALKDTSPSINAGTNTASGTDPVGIPYTNDIGAFVHEFGTKYAISTARNEVGATVDGATAGDVISIPSGTSDWTNTLIVLKPLTLQGAGAGSTVLLDDIVQVDGDNTTQSVIDLEATNAPFYRITGISINRGITKVVAPASTFGVIQVQATKPVRIDHVAFGQPLNRCVYFQGGWGSLIDHCTFIQNDEQGIFVGAKGLFPPADNWGDGSYATPTPFGTTNGLVIEDSYFEDVRPAPGIGKNAVDSQYGAVWTFRYNTVVNANVGAHGSESGARVRSAKQYEIYHNTFTTDGRESTAFNPRGGTGVIWSNTASGYNNLARINVNRSTDSFSTWGGATGTNPFDSNDPFGVYATGTHTGTNAATQLTKSGAGWTPNQWYAYTVTNAASGLFSIITSNSTDTIYYLGAKANLGISNPLTWDTGDTFRIQRVLVVLDQVGYSTGGRMSNNPPSPLTWIGDTSVPLYSWGNSIGGMDEVVSGYPSCQENRDYFNSTPKPGYVALVYPHPWIGGGGSIPPFIIGPPQNITIRVGGNASFSVTASGDSPLAYQWLLSGSEISGATTTVYTTNNVTFNANGAQYSVVVTNAFGSVTSSPALLTVQNLALMSGNIHLKGNGHSK